LKAHIQGEIKLHQNAQGSIWARGSKTQPHPFLVVKVKYGLESLSDTLCGLGPSPGCSEGKNQRKANQ
jgi:hypothetical protein